MHYILGAGQGLEGQRLSTRDTNGTGGEARSMQPRREAMTNSNIPAPAKGFGINEAVIALFTVATIVIAGALSLTQLGVALT